jgi:hypothetical protein
MRSLLKAYYERIGAAIADDVMQTPTPSHDPALDEPYDYAALMRLGKPQLVPFPEIEPSRKATQPIIRPKPSCEY